MFIFFLKHLTLCLPVETGASKLIKELRIVMFEIAENADRWQRFQEGLQAAHLSIQSLFLFVALGVSLDEKHEHLVDYSLSVTCNANAFVEISCENLVYAATYSNLCGTFPIYGQTKFLN